MYLALSKQERGMRCILQEDTCIIHGKRFYGGKYYFIRGDLAVPVIDLPLPLIYTVWVSLSKQDFERAVALWNSPQRAEEPPYPARLATSVPNYPETHSLKARLLAPAAGARLSIELEPTEHPLAIEQRDGIDRARVQEIAELMQHPEGAA
jgi:hypothetical protein